PLRISTKTVWWSWRLWAGIDFLKLRPRDDSASKCRLAHLSAERGRALLLALQASDLEEQFPVLDFGRVANERRNRPFLRRARCLQELKAGLVRQAVRLPLVHSLCRPNQVLPGVLATARARHDVVHAALIRAQHAAGVLATVAVALANIAGAEL